MYKIKFGTDGWRDIIGDHFNNTNVRRVAYATSEWLKSSDLPKKIVIGHDCRLAGNMFAKEAACIFASHEIDVVFAQSFVSTPMISLAAKKLNAGVGIIITASHNPPSYNGFKIKAAYGGPATPSTIDEIEKLIPDLEITPSNNFDYFLAKGRITLAEI
jgi:phosphomannomutase